MPTSVPVPRVLVVGAGPSGLVVALSLLKNGVHVRLIDKSPSQRLGQRGAGIMPRSLELFHLLGVGNRIIAEARAMPMVKLYTLHGGLNPLDTFELNPTEEPTASTPYPNLILLGQDALERILRDELRKYGCEVELGTELVSFTQAEMYVDVQLSKNSVTQNARYSWLVGADGARSTVRKQLGAVFLGETPNLNNIVVGDMKVDGLDNQFWHMWGDAASTLISLRPTNSPCLFSFVISGDGVDHRILSTDIDSLRQLLLHKTGTCNSLVFGELTWISTYRPNIRMADRFGDRRVFLAGDSCHVISFTGGQGMNTGIQDAFNLGWKLAHVERRHSPYSLLDTYSKERLPVAGEMLEQTTTLLNKEFQGKRNGAFAQLRVNCRTSSIVLDEQETESDGDFYYDMDDGYDSDQSRHGDGDLRAGDRAPDAPGLVNITSTSTRLFDIFGPSHHTILIFSQNLNVRSLIHHAVKRYPGSIRTALICPASSHLFKSDQVDYVLEDQYGHAHDAYTARKAKIVITRPDGVVGAMLQNVAGLRRYFDKIFVHT